MKTHQNPQAMLVMRVLPWQVLKSPTTKHVKYSKQGLIAEECNVSYEFLPKRVKCLCSHSTNYKN